MMHSLLAVFTRLSRIEIENARDPTYFAVIVTASAASVALSSSVTVAAEPPVPTRTKYPSFAPPRNMVSIIPCVLPVPAPKIFFTLVLGSNFTTWLSGPQFA